MDRESTLYGPDDHTGIVIRESGSIGYSVDADPGTYYIVQNIFPDVVYEDETIWRVPGGYIFQGSDAYSDGGEFVLLQKTHCGENILADVFAETTVRIPCEPLTLGLDYLLEHYSDPELGLFENLDQIVAFLEEYAVYPRRLYDSNDPNLAMPYPFWCSAYWPELFLYTRVIEAEELLYGSLLFEAYPYILDSLGYPGMIGAAAEALNPDCTAEGGDAHYEVIITLNGEQRIYGGDGEGPSASYDAAHSAKLFAFQGEDDLGINNSLTRFRNALRNQEYLQQTSQLEEVDYFAFVDGEVFHKYMEEQGSSWFRVGMEGFLGGGISFAYMAASDGETRVLSDAWVDGRYIGEREIINLHASFEEHPQADILLHDVTYADRYGQSRTTDVLFEYNSTLNAWTPDWPGSTYYESPEELPEALILTQEEVASLGIDRNKDHWPDHGLIYDGTVFPGTPFEITLVSGITLPETLEIVIGQELILIPEISPADAEDIRTHWEVTDDTILKLTEFLDEDRIKLCGLAEGTVVVTATTVDGSYSASCTVTVVATCTEHSYLEEVHPPTCTEGGYTAYTCERCGDSYISDETAALGHDMSAWTISKAPTCEKAGEEQRTCSRCDYAETRTVNAAGHDYEQTVTEPTCTEDGYTTYVCSVCGDTFTDNHRGALGHDFENGICIRCGETDPNYMEPAENPFTDVKDGDYFLAPVLWAVEKGITAGTGNGQFSPNAACTRAQVVTFLWRAKGSPEPVTAISPFEDVADPDVYYYKAVLWACENGITAGVSETNFAPDDICTRGQVATFLHRTALTPSHAGDNPFEDVTKGAYYYNAVLWAYENGITAGTGESSFSPNQNCTRGQIVTFLYRARSYFAQEDVVEMNMLNWSDYFEILLKEQAADHSGRMVPNHQYYIAVKDGADWERHNFEEILIFYRYNIMKCYYSVDEDGAIVMDSEAVLTETKEETIAVTTLPVLLAEKGVHGHTSAGRFFVYLPTDLEVVRVIKRVYQEESLDRYITFETNGLISDEMARKIQDLLYKTYPLIFEYFADGQYEKITCTIETRDGVASTVGRNITVSADYLNQHPNDLDCITHELVHCAQAYPNNAVGWLTEGIADYGRYLFGLYNEASGWKLPAYSQNQSYQNGYRVSAAFLKYVVERHEEEMVHILNAALRDNTYTEDLWKEHTNYSLNELWELYAKDRAAMQ